MSELFTVFVVVLLSVLLSHAPLAITVHTENEKREVLEAEAAHNVELAIQRKAEEHGL
jgi:hypothetical protein